MKDATPWCSHTLVFDGDHPGELTPAAFSLQPAVPGGAVLQLELAGICGADLHNFHGWFNHGRVVLGHEFVGRLVEVNGDVRDASGRPLQVGDRVAPESQIPCRRCRFCRGFGSRADKVVDYNACEASVLFGTVPIGDPPRVLGGWAEYVEIPPNAILHRVDESLPLEIAVLLEPFAVAVKAVSKAGVQPGDTVAVQGPGPIGLLCVAAARAAGATRIALVGTNPARLAAGAWMGADLLISPQTGDPAAELRQATGGRLADRVIDATVAQNAFQQGLDLTGRAGVYVNIGGFRPTDQVSFRPDRLKREKIDIRFSHMGSNAYEPALEIMLSRRFPLERLITQRFPLLQAEDALHLLERREGGAIKIALAP